MLLERILTLVTQLMYFCPIRTVGCRTSFTHDIGALTAPPMAGSVARRAAVSITTAQERII